MTKRVIILAADGFDSAELTETRRALDTAGFTTQIAAPEAGTIRGWIAGDTPSAGSWGDDVTVDLLIDDVDSEDALALIVPGGPFSPDTLRTLEAAIDLVEEFDAEGHLIAAIGKGTALLIEADVVGGRTVTGAEALHTDLENAGGDVVNRPVAIDDNLLTSRTADDVPALIAALTDALEDEGDEEEEDTEDEED